MLTTHFLPDQPVLTLEDDALGLTAFAEQVHGAILGARSPFVLGAALATQGGVLCCLVSRTQMHKWEVRA